VKLLNIVLNSLKAGPNRCILWTDSSVVLNWIKTPAHLLKTLSLCISKYESSFVPEIKANYLSFAIPVKTDPFLIKRFSNFCRLKRSIAYTLRFIKNCKIKSTGKHKRVVDNVHLPYEELYSLLVKIEAIMNSRPLSPLSSDPLELTPLTPGHFPTDQVDPYQEQRPRRSLGCH